MKVKDIHVDGFGVWSGLSVDSLPESMTLFYGPNEAGKTTLMQFLRAMLYGFTPERRGRYLPPVHGGTPGGAIRVTGPGGGYEIRRHAQLTDSGSLGQLAVTGQDGLSQGQHRLSMLLGQIDEAIFTNVFAIGIRELQELSTLDDTAAADELYKLSSGLDRVSLVDVLRSLKAGRKSLVGTSKADEDQAAVLTALVARRERLRDEVHQLTQNGRRWTELASRRRSQAAEIEELTARIERRRGELRCVEVGSAVLESWRQREQIVERIARDEARSELPDEAPSQLVQIEAVLQERKTKLEEVKAKRRELRDRSAELPLDRRLLELQGKIDAAAQQATWVEALEEQIARLDKQIEKAKEQLQADADQLGLDEEQRELLVEGASKEMPDLSRQALAALAGPAKDIKSHLFVLKQAREEAREHQTQADKVGGKLAGALAAAQSSNLQDALRRQSETIATLRSRVQIEQHLEKLRRHFRELEKESLDLATDEAYPLEQRILLFVPFMVGGLGTIYGMVHVLGWSWFFEEPNPTWGATMVLVGLISFFLWYFVRERGDTGTKLELEDCERRIDTVRRQIREFEVERDDLDARLPAGHGSLDTRLREAEQLLAELEAAMPAFHTQQAAIQASKASRNRASEAAEGLKAARRAWTVTLQRLGLNESMSPSSIRRLSDNYEAVQASRRRLDELEAECDLRRRERATLTKRIDSLYIEALGDGTASAQHGDGRETDAASAAGRRREHDGRREAERGDRQGRRPGRDPRESVAVSSSATAPGRRPDPLRQLQELQEAVAGQHHWIKRRRDLRDQDQQLKRMHSSCLRTIERCEQQRRSLWAKCGVANAEQFYSIVDLRTQLNDCREKAADLDKQIRGIIGTQVAYDDVIRELDGASAADLQKRFDSLSRQIEETQARIAVLRTSQGELSQEMKQLAEDERPAIAQLELACVERRIESLVRKWQTLAMASSLLEDVCATFERERQPETLREASSFLRQLTDGKYTRVWTPLGTNQLKVDTSDGQSLQLDVLSRGTREAVFIALRLSLAAAYARRGVMLPLILDDVLVNFDRTRAHHAARTLKTFAEMGHQVLMFTCHRHIADIFREIDVQVRVLPQQGVPGRATLMPTEPAIEDEPEPDEVEPIDSAEVEESESQVDEEVMQSPLEDEPAFEEPPAEEPVEEPEPVLVQIAVPKKEPKPKATKKPKPEPEPVAAEAAEPSLDWHWYEREQQDEWHEETPPVAAEPEGIWDRNRAWWTPAESAPVR